MEGFYSDPLHGHCLRRIRVMVPFQSYRIDGVYGHDEPNDGGYWHAHVRVLSRTETRWSLQVDFSGKPTKKKKVLKASFFPQSRRIQWEDRNVWKQMYTHPTQLR